MVGKGEDDGGSRREGERGQGCVGVIVQWQIMWESHWGKAPTNSWENETEQCGRQIPFIRSAQVLLKPQFIQNLTDMSNNTVTIHAEETMTCCQHSSFSLNYKACSGGQLCMSGSHLNIQGPTRWHHCGVGMPLNLNVRRLPEFEVHWND